MDKEHLLGRIEAAKRYVNAAELELDNLMREIRAEPRAQKVTASAVMQDAFEKLRAAKVDVLELEKMVRSEE
jgi:hypothetical protein